jgi:hypothetical protein
MDNEKVDSMAAQQKKRGVKEKNKTEKHDIRTDMNNKPVSKRFIWYVSSNSME